MANPIRGASACNLRTTLQLDPEYPDAALLLRDLSRRPKSNVELPLRARMRGSSRKPFFFPNASARDVSVICVVRNAGVDRAAPCHAAQVRAANLAGGVATVTKFVPD